MAESLPDHHCPGCGKPQKVFARYPWYFCKECIAKTADGDGRAVAFYSQTANGSMAWFYRDDKSRMQANVLTVRCLILGRPVEVSQARFGGLVAQPLSSHHEVKFDAKSHPDLTSSHGIKAAIALMIDGE